MSALWFLNSLLLSGHGLWPFEDYKITFTCKHYTGSGQNKLGLGTWSIIQGYSETWNVDVQ